jgi:metal iron transporter
MRRVLTRIFSLIPAMVVAVAVGRSGVDQLLVISQVVLSIVLPFIVFPLVWLTTNKEIMSVKSADSDEVVDFSNGKITATLGYLIWLIILVANVYVIVQLGLGKAG